MDFDDINRRKTVIFIFMTIIKLNKFSKSQIYT